MRRAKYTLYAINTLQTARWFKESEIRAGWHRSLQICKSLSDDGFDFQVTVASEGDRVVIGIFGTAGRAKAQRRVARKVAIIPAPVSVAKCRKMADEARRAAVRAEVVPFPRNGWNSRYLADLEVREKAKDRRVGRLIARALARGEDTIPAAKFYGEGHFMAFAPVNVKQALQACEEARKRRGAVPSNAPNPAELLEARKLALAEYKYWRELELLSGQRARFKPGLTDETAYADDEVAA